MRGSEQRKTRLILDHWSERLEKTVLLQLVGSSCAGGGHEDGITI